MNCKIWNAAYYFPGYHAEKRNDRIHGPGWSEWELMKCARPRFAGHDQPKVPLHGWGDESDPAEMAVKIEDASSHGIDVFVFDWYWYNGEQFLEKPLNEAFLNAPNRNRLKFAIMWANHNWGIWPALDDGPRAMNGNENQASREPFLFVHHS